MNRGWAPAPIDTRNFTREGSVLTPVFPERFVGGFPPFGKDGEMVSCDTKPTNPKDRVGSMKAPLSLVPGRVLMRVALAMLEGMLKYGAYNYRAAGVRHSIYIDAAFRHLISHNEGEDNDPDSGLPHVVKAVASLIVLMDSIMEGNAVDDRVPAKGTGHGVAEANALAKRLVEKRRGEGQS